MEGEELPFSWGGGRGGGAFLKILYQLALYHSFAFLYFGNKELFLNPVL